MKLPCQNELLSLLALAGHFFLAGCGEVEESAKRGGGDPSYLPFPPEPAPELTAAEEKLLDRKDFVRIEPGEFEMGSPSDETGRSEDEVKHRVKITKPYYVAKTEVTVEQWNLFQPSALRRDEAFFLPDGMREVVVKLKHGLEKTVKTRPNPLALNPDERAYTLKAIEGIVEILRERLERKERQAGLPTSVLRSYLGQAEKFLEERERLPITGVSYPQAKTFCWIKTQRAWEKETIPRSMIFRLPTEAEWEYACRAGAKGVCGLDEGNELSGMNANINGGKPGYIIGGERSLIFRNSLVSAATSKSKYPANLWGIRDMHGNVYEWCYDYYGDYPEGTVVDPRGPIRGTKRVLRGGSFLSIAQQSRSAARHSVEPSWRGSEIGFRLVLGFPH